MTRRISRRAFLGGAGATLALPFLPSLRSAGGRFAEAAPAPPGQRFVACYVPNGALMSAFTPAAAGAAWEITPALEPLAAFRDRLLPITGLDNRPAIPEGPGNHATATAAFLTAHSARFTRGEDIANAISLDQRIAQAIGGDTRLPSLQVGLQDGVVTGDCDYGYSCAYLHSVSWRDATTPLPPITSPRVLFDRLFAGTDGAADAEEAARRRARRASVLDYVLTDAQSLSGKLGRSDRIKLDQYMEGVRALEIQVAALDQAPLCDPPPAPAAALDVRAHARVAVDLLVLALQCGITRVASFMLARGFSERFYDFLGVSAGHHTLSHHFEDPELKAELLAVNRWHLEQLAYLLERLDAVDEADASLLDKTLVLWGSGMADGNEHTIEGLPMLLCGQLGDAIRPGRHLVVPEATPLANLHLAILRGFGLDDATFGDDSTGPLEGLS